MKDINKIKSLCKALFEVLQKGENCQARELFAELKCSLIEEVPYRKERITHYGNEVEEIDHSNAIELKNLDPDLSFHPIVKAGSKFFVRTVFFTDKKYIRLYSNTDWKYGNRKGSDRKKVELFEFLTVLAKQEPEIIPRLERFVMQFI